MGETQWSYSLLLHCFQLVRHFDCYYVLVCSCCLLLRIKTDVPMRFSSLHWFRWQTIACFWSKNRRLQWKQPPSNSELYCTINQSFFGLARKFQRCLQCFTVLVTMPVRNWGVAIGHFRHFVTLPVTARADTCLFPRNRERMCWNTYILNFTWICALQPALDAFKWAKKLFGHPVYIYIYI